MVYTKSWAIAQWSNRATANYSQLNQTINGKTCDCFGNLSGEPDFNNGIPKNVCYYEETDSVIYYSFQPDNSSGVIYKYTKQ